MHCFCLSSICLWTLVFPTFWLLWIVLLWTFVHLCLNIFLSEHLFSVLLGAYPGVDVARSYGNSMFNLLRFSIPAEKNLHFYQQQTRVPCFLIFFNILSTHQNLSFYGSSFWYYFKSLSLSPRSQRFSLILASKSFIILHLTFLFIWNNFYIILIHLKQFWDVEIIWVKVLFCFVFSVYGYSIAPAPVVEDYPSSIELLLHLLSKTSWLYLCRAVSGLPRFCSIGLCVCPSANTKQTW